jgi:ABC-type transport system involved in multi-copper enzyme maturation permease subunit
MNPFNWPVLVVARWEMRGAARSRWVLVVAGIYTAAAIGITLISLRSMSALGLRGVGAAVDGLIGLAILIPPLFGILLGAGILSRAREEGMLSLVAAQPIRRSAITWGTALGATVTVWSGLGVGLGLVAAIIAPTATPADVAGFAVVVAVTLAAGAVGVVLGTLVSVLNSNRGQAMLVAAAIWFVAALGVDVLLATTAPANLGPGGLFTVTVLNPMAAIRTLGLAVVDPASLGAFGIHLHDWFGPGGVTLLLGSVVAVWLLVPLLAATRWLRRVDA